MVVQRKSELWKRAKREIERSGLLGLADVIAFRLAYGIFSRSNDIAWGKSLIERWSHRFPSSAADASERLEVRSPNSTEAREFIERLKPDIMIARCKFILKKEIFDKAEIGTFVMHPGHCPEYRNAHGCFWAIVQGDLAMVSMTLLKVDEGIDTGPVYGYYSYPFDPRSESHFQIQARVVIRKP